MATWSALASWMLLGVCGCGPSHSDFAGPAASSTATETASPAGPVAHVVRKPAIAPRAADATRIETWDELLAAQEQLDRDIDRWVADCRQGLPAADGYRLAVLRQVHGTGGFLREVNYFIEQLSTSPNSLLLAALQRLQQRWLVFQRDLARIVADSESEAGK